MPATVRAIPGQIQEPGIPSGSYTWVVMTFCLPESDQQETGWATAGLKPAPQCQIQASQCDIQASQAEAKLVGPK